MRAFRGWVKVIRFKTEIVAADRTDDEEPPCLHTYSPAAHNGTILSPLT